ncbi:hypothetical protein OPV22_024365 [Ensete ventricosum]|uniref:DUF2415 domain-containing protein n=1 Tax=Ensete ventricosum TaxID=4639 RepID=A0AAV8QU77_ENSVE|nr:hypothetical protein OPV22_024365 [Ensete ventricosum]
MGSARIVVVSASSSPYLGRAKAAHRELGADPGGRMRIGRLGRGEDQRGGPLPPPRRPKWEGAKYSEMGDAKDDVDAEFQERGVNEADSDDEAYDQYNGKVTDISAAQTRKGIDIQGIPWDRLNFSREDYRRTRLEQYKNYENVPNSGVASEKAGNLKRLFDRRNSRSVRSTILHFQLRNLVWATSKHDVYLMSHYSLVHWSALTRDKYEVLNLAGHVAPRQKHPGNLTEGFSQTQYLDREGISFCCRATYDDNAITNAIEIYNSSSGALHFMASNNDSGIRDFDMEKFQLCKHFHFHWPVNHTSLSPDGKLLVVVGDNPEGALIDACTGKTVQILRGHLDFSFASAWNPDGYTIATGNQDKTCRVWDVRNPSKSLAVLRGNLGAIRSIRFTSDGQFMAMAEPADFVHIFDVRSGYNERQELDFFGEISGISFSPDAEALFK